MATDATPVTAPGALAAPAPRPQIGARLRAVGRSAALAPRHALVAMVLAALVMVAVAAAQPSLLSPPSHWEYPLWLSGPLTLVSSWYHGGTRALEWIFSIGLVVMFAGYLIVLARVRELSVRHAVIAVVALHVVLFLAPPLPLTDVFNYVNYGRMEIVHHLNPYSTLPVLEPHGDPSYEISNWHRLLSPYGPLFTILTFALVPLGVPVSFWVLKAVLMGSSLLLLWLVWRCAALLGRDPLAAMLFVGLNPVVLVWGLGGDHNDFVLMVLLVGGIYLLLSARARRSGLAAAAPGGRRLLTLLDGAPRPLPPGEPGPARELGGGFLLVAALAIKASVGVMFPVVVLCVPRRLRVVSGMAIGAVVLGAATVYAFGPHLPNLSDQSSVITSYAIPNLIGIALGAGGETSAMATAGNVILLCAIAGTALWGLRSGRWITASGVAVLVLLVTLGWLLPWYVLWLLPLAALSHERWLRTVALLLSLFLLLTWAPVTGLLLHSVGFNPAGTQLGKHHQLIVRNLF